MARRQFTDVFENVLALDTTINVASIASGSSATSVVTVPGAAVGDFVLVQAGTDLLDLTATGYVQAANTVEIVLQNQSGGARDLPSTTFYVLVLKVNPGVWA